MSSSTLLRCAALAAILAGALRIVSSFISAGGDDAELLYLVIDLGFLFGLTGIYLSAHQRIGILGFAGFAIAFPAAASIVGPDGVLYGVSLYQVGGGLLVLGLAILGVAQLRARIGRRTSSIAWIVAFVAAIATVIPGVAAAAFAVTGVAFGAAFIAAGVELWNATSQRASATRGSAQ
jgi:hypothetical protein